MTEQDSERHWSTISIGIVTIATAAIGGALFAVEPTAASTTLTLLATYFLELIAVFVYLYVLVLGGRVIFASPTELSRQKTSKREVARLQYTWFFVELLAIAGLLISQANSSLSQLFAFASSL